MVESGLSCLIDLLGRSRGDGRGWKVGSGVVARGGGEVARRDIAGGGGGVSFWEMWVEVIRRERMIRERAQITSVNLSPFQKARALAGEEAPGRGDWKWRDGVTSEDPKAERGGIQFLSSHILPCDLLDMRPFIISVPVLVFFALLSCAAPLLHVASGPETTAPFPNELRPLVMAYYPDWASGSLPPEKIDYGRFDWIDFAFALPDQSFALTWDDPVNAPALLDRLVASAHDAGRRVKLSIGGWTGSRYTLCSLTVPHICIQPLL